ncbi:hydroxysqualene dehydroxylase HpnE [Massilia pseudoviolaceinigra]|uniref:hydroxysqualene dehydroxylase HpnE n=1 Tax=Massilia pseudoviolaceinigra TaxID=3057165 RepID=UPI0027964DF7|nr:hydroxysqualene dehydroxylase HpnE [Massilia sp. CCM 9206]MDQ1922006.1 hydroxysqualene dehydroxylase HpnE [Massilia sp. CCM 9206]
MSAAVIGAGWAGCSAAVELARAGCKVTLFEAARTLGGRARAVDVQGRQLDNGQHILLGAYKESLRLMRAVGIDLGAAMLYLPLQMRYPKESGGMDFVAPRLPAPLHLALALLSADGLAFADKMALARFSSTARWMGWRLHTDCSVSELLERYDQTDRLIELMWRPLCLAALNTAPERASAQVFLAVLRDSLGASRASSDMLLPRVDLSALFPVAAAAFVERAGGAVRLGAKVGSLAPADATGGWLLGEGERFGAVVIATAPPAAATLLEQAGAPELAASLQHFEYEPITTCYLQYPAATRLDLPFYALRDNAASGHWGQFVFDRGQLDAAQAGLFSVVISASGAASEPGREALAQAVASQLAAVLRRPELSHPEWVQVISEKRATFACTPGLARPANATGLASLALAGDYTASDYPATIESAVRSGVAAARVVLSAKATKK